MRAKFINDADELTPPISRPRGGCGRPAAPCAGARFVGDPVARRGD